MKEYTHTHTHNSFKNLFKIIGIIILLGIIIIYYRVYIIKENSYSKNKEDERGIEIIPYSNSDNKLWVQVVFFDYENGINKIFKNNSEEQIISNGKSRVGIDYLIEQNGQYTFKAINGRNQEISKTLVVNDDFRNNLIGISSYSESEISSTVEISIDYKNINHGKHMYKIGNDTSWSEYTEPFSIVAEDIIENELYDEENTNKTLLIYAKVEDDSNRKIEISKKIVNLDLELLQAPQITMNGSKYPTLFKEGMFLGSDVTITYTNRTDCKNYYSLDNENWKEYTGPFSIPTFKVYAKSVKTSSGVEVSSQATINDSQIAGDALPSECYDNDINTYYTMDSSCVKRFNVDASARTLGLTFILYDGTSYSGRENYLTSYNALGEATVLYESGQLKDNNNLEKCEIPKDSVYIIWSWGATDLYDHSGCYEIGIDAEFIKTPEIYRTGYPTLFASGMKYKFDFTINYTNRTDCKNYYSVDNQNWKEYTGPVSISVYTNTVYAKSVNATSGFEVSVQLDSESTNELPRECYDGDIDTYYTMKNDGICRKRFDVFFTARGKTLKFRIADGSSYANNLLTSYNSSGQATVLYTSTDGTKGNNDLEECQIPLDSVYIIWSWNAPWYYWCSWCYEIGV